MMFWYIQVFYQFIFVGVICDLTSFPKVTNAHHKLHNTSRHSDGLKLPGDVHIEYICDTGYRMMSETNATIGCNYTSTRREGSESYDESVMSAEWENTSHIVCTIGKFVMHE